MDLHREMVDKVLQSILKSKTSPVLKDDKYDAVINFLKHPSTCKDKHFRHWVKSKQPYKLVFGQNPRSQLIPGAEQNIVIEEEITEVTQSSAVPVASDEQQSSPPAEIPPQAQHLATLQRPTMVIPHHSSGNYFLGVVICWCLVLIINTWVDHVTSGKVGWTPDCSLHPCNGTSQVRGLWNIFHVLTTVIQEAHVKITT